MPAIKHQGAPNSWSSGMAKPTRLFSVPTAFAISSSMHHLPTINIDRLPCDVLCMI